MFEVLTPATISNNALQITPDSAGNFTLSHRSGRVFFNQPFRLLWEESQAESVASFNTSFLINLFRINNSTITGEGLAFLISPDLHLPPNSDGQYLGLTNRITDGSASNGIVAVEFDTFKQDFDPDDNHIGLDIHSVHSKKTVSLSDHGIQLAPVGTSINHMVWIQYDGVKKELQVYMAEEGKDKPASPLLSSDLDLKDLVQSPSYFGFAASTGSAVQLNCVLGWNLTVSYSEPDSNSNTLPYAEPNINNNTPYPEPNSNNNTLPYPEPDSKNKKKKLVKIGLGIGVPGLALLLMGAAALTHYCYGRRRRTGPDPNLLGALKNLPGTPREFGFKELRKATNNFDGKNKLGKGGFGVVYKGVLPNENLTIAVKKFNRSGDNLKSQDDFLAELIIINRLRHKHLVRLLGWCHKNETLLLVYDYMPNGSLDKHLFHGRPDQEKTTVEQDVLKWKLRYKVISGVASALHYLHNEYDQKVVHRDLKASNIMLDSDFNARLGDFGLARALENEKTSYAELHDGMPGTVGYIAPECFLTGKATCESDVYGFGAVLLEVVCGRRPWTKIAGFNFLVDWVWWLHREGRILEAVDEKLGNEYDVEEARRLLLLGLVCSHPVASERPQAQAILQIISGSMAVPHVPPFKPPFVWSSSAAGGRTVSNFWPSSNIINIEDDITADITALEPR